MKTFEIHITVDLDDASLFKNICHLADIKCIEIESLNIYGQNIDTQHMTSIIKKFIDKKEAIEFAKSLSYKFGKCNISVHRTKVESPIYNEYLNDALYVETHFESDQFVFPTSRNVNKNTLLATHREYDKSMYNYFIDIHRKKDHELELCLYDTNINLDTEWFNCYGTIT